LDTSSVYLITLIKVSILIKPQHLVAAERTEIVTLVPVTPKRKTSTSGTPPAPPTGKSSL
jgi:hypothetical protein